MSYPLHTETISKPVYRVPVIVNLASWCIKIDKLSFIHLWHFDNKLLDKLCRLDGFFSTQFSSFMTKTNCNKSEICNSIHIIVEPLGLLYILFIKTVS